jgi:superfamily II DNA or RNA helicase
MSGKGVYSNKNCLKFTKNKKFIPLEIQENTLNYFIKSKYKGLLVFHQLGAGKTCTSILIADNLIRNKKINHVYILTPGSLRQNWIEEYCSRCGQDFIQDNFTFITYNYNVSKHIENLNFNNSLIIIDEVHKFINSVKNNSVNAFEIYNKIYNSNCKILLLSGTPIFNETYEFSLIGNLLKPNVFPNIIENDEINLLRWSDDNITDKNLQGIISYYPGDSKNYPNVYYKNPIKIMMSKDQSIRYLYYFTMELTNINIGPPKSKLKYTNPEEYKKKYEKYIMSIKHINSRQALNFFYKDKILKKFSDKKMTLKTDETDDNEILRLFKNYISTKYSDNDDNDDNYRKEGWINDNYFLNNKLLTEYSPKFAAILLNIVLNLDTKHVVYTFFKTKGGLDMLKYFLDKCGIKNEIFSGDLDDKKRQKLLNNFNNPNNLNGEKIKVLLLSEAGAEGITLKDVNNFHIVESSNESLIKQAIGRVVRYKSHENSPENRNYVNIWRYWSVLYNTKLPTLDQLLFDKGVTKIQKNELFIARLIQNSIENIQ